MQMHVDFAIAIIVAVIPTTNCTRMNLLADATHSPTTTNPSKKMRAVSYRKLFLPAARGPCTARQLYMSAEQCLSELPKMFSAAKLNIAKRTRQQKTSPAGRGLIAAIAASRLGIASANITGRKA